MHDFGYVALNLKYVYPEDSGTYTCRALNELGQAVTSATLNVQCKKKVLFKIYSLSVFYDCMITIYNIFSQSVSSVGKSTRSSVG